MEPQLVKQTEATMRETLKEFKSFATRGNVVDMAVGVIVGAAFGKIVTSMVEDILMPPIGKLLGGVDFKDLFFVLGDKSFASLKAAKEAGAAAIAYGQFLNTLINFVIIAWSVFMAVKFITALRKRLEAETPTAPATKECPFCCSAIPVKATRCGHCTSQVV
jgi:large conductance mechanosensitive channel